MYETLFLKKKTFFKSKLQGKHKRKDKNSLEEVCSKIEIKRESDNTLYMKEVEKSNFLAMSGTMRLEGRH